MDQRLIELATRIADALDRLAPPPPAPPALESAEAFVWHPAPARLAPVAKVSRVEIGLLHGVERQKRLLLDNTLRFARGLPANNAMLWGARGMGKSSLVKATHTEANRAVAGDDAQGAIPGGGPGAAPGDSTRGAPARDLASIALIEIHREDIRTLPELLTLLRGQPRRCLILCDDLSFEREDTDYKALKSILDGGIEGRPENVLFYATSNRRHLMPRDMIENERSTAINPSEATEENRLPQLRPGNVLCHGGRLRRRPAPADRRGGAACGGERVVGDARLPLWPRRLAVHPGFGRTAGGEDGLPAGEMIILPRCRRCRLAAPFTTTVHAAAQPWLPRGALFRGMRADSPTVKCSRRLDVRHGAGTAHPKRNDSHCLSRAALLGHPHESCDPAGTFMTTCSSLGIDSAGARPAPIRYAQPDRPAVRTG